MKVLYRFWCFPLLGLVITACGEPTTAAPAPVKIDRVVFSPASLELFIGDSAPVNVFAFSEDGDALPPELDVVSDAIAVVLVSESRNATLTFYARAAAYGTATLAATDWWIDDVMLVSTFAAGVEIAGVGNGDTIASGTVLKLDAIPLNVRGTAEGATGAPVQWLSSDPSIVGVNDSGLIWTGAPGIATLTASVEKGESSRVTVTVLPGVFQEPPRVSPR